MNAVTNDDPIPQGVRAFNLLTLFLLNRLYETFPERIDLPGIPTVIEIAAEPAELKDIDFARYLADTVDWLEEEGFIRIHNKDLAGNYYGVGLTLRGLSALGYADTALPKQDAKEPLIAKIRRVLSKSAEGAASETVQAIVGKALELMMRQV